MNWVELSNRIKDIALQQPAVESVYIDDVYEAWNSAEVRYASVAAGLENVTYEGNMVTYSVILYYGDRLLQSKANANSVISDGVRVLQSIINILNSSYEADIPEVNIYTPFEQKFMDYLAGVYATVEITTDSELGLCGIDDMEDDIDRDYLRFTALEDGSCVGFQQSTLGTQFSYDGHNWENATKTGGEVNMFELNSGQTLYVRAMGVIPNFNTAIGGNVKVSGNINTINNYKYDDKELRNFGYKYLFGNCSGLTDASELVLPSEKVGVDAYSQMFSNCTNLVYAPKILPATELERYCYSEMFEECISLITAPELPATKLAGFCYDGMFKNCVSLTTAPELPAETLFANAYQYMFSGCQSLNYIKCLATNISMVNCTKEWVNGVAETGTFVKNEDMDDWTVGINGIPEDWVVKDDKEETRYITFTALENDSFVKLMRLGGNQTVDYSYNGETWETMVNGRTLLLQSGECVYLRGILSETPDEYDSTLFQNGGRMKLSGNINAIWDYTADDLEAGFQLKEWCGRQMFQACREIVDISELKMPSENLAWGCYAEMFGYNRNITVAPELPATTLYGYCYSQMFYSCSSLQEIKCMAMNTMEYGEIPCTDYWLDGVAATGTFTKNMNMTQWGTGADGIPEGWEIHNATIDGNTEIQE